MGRLWGALLATGFAWSCVTGMAHAVKNLSGVTVIGIHCNVGIEAYVDGAFAGCVDGGDSGGFGGQWDPDIGAGGGGPVIRNRGDTAPNKPNADEKSLCDKSGSPTTAGNPVVFSTGNKIEPATDFVSAGEMPLSLTRTYNHYWDGIGIFGRRWLSNYDYKLLFTTDDPTSPCYPRPGNTSCDPVGQPIWAQRPDGRKIKFNYATSPAPGWYEDKPSPIAKILKSGTDYQLYSGNPPGK